MNQTPLNSPCLRPIDIAKGDQKLFLRTWFMETWSYRVQRCRNSPYLQGVWDLNVQGYLVNWGMDHCISCWCT